MVNNYASWTLFRKGKNTFVKREPAGIITAGYMDALNDSKNDTDEKD